MENNEQNMAPEEELDPKQEELTDIQEEVIPTKQGYSPRPKHQVWIARIGLVAFIIVLIVYYMVYFRGGR